MAAALLLLHAQTHAEPPQSPPAPTQQSSRGWSSLSPTQQTALQPLQRKWSSIDGAQKSKWIEVANKFSTLSLAERARIQGRMADWAQMSARERGETRLNFKEVQKITPGERRAKWDVYSALPLEERQQLASRAQSGYAAEAGPARAGANAVKANVVPSTTKARPTVVAPSIVQAQSGATTTLLTRVAAPPLHHPSGRPKIATSASLIDSTTLLPKVATRPEARASATSAPPKQQP